VDIKLKIWFGFYFQAKKSKEDLKEITHKVYFDVEIDGKPAGMFFLWIILKIQLVFFVPVSSLSLSLVNLKLWFHIVCCNNSYFAEWKSLHRWFEVVVVLWVVL
jgi:hypothetical protein